MCSLFGVYYQWKRIEYFNEDWKQRIEMMSRYIDKNDSVVDMGCGLMWLEKYIPNTVEYHAVDYKYRDKNTVICDFNKLEYPNISADIYFLSGLLEYIRHPNSLIENICTYSEKCIISYCTVDIFDDIPLRRYRGWESHLSKSELIDIFTKNNMYLLSSECTATENTVFVFCKAKCRHY